MDRLGEEVDKCYLNNYRSLVRTLVDLLLVPDLLLLMCFVHVAAHGWNAFFLCPVINLAMASWTMPQCPNHILCDIFNCTLFVILKGVIQNEKNIYCFEVLLERFKILVNVISGLIFLQTIIALVPTWRYKFACQEYMVNGVHTNIFSGYHGS